MAKVDGKVRKRLAKNKKKSWRFTDITDVEEHLDDRRLQERTGGIVAERKDDLLFYVDKEIDREPRSTKAKKSSIKKPLKCHSLLVDIKDEWPKIPSKRLRRRSKLQDKESVSASTLARGTNEKGRKTIKDHSSVNQDLWAPDTEPCDSEEVNHYKKVTRKTRVKPPKHYCAKTSGINAVEVIESGASYNPTFHDHQELLLKAHRKQAAMEKEEQKIKHALDDVFPSSGISVEKEYLTEMSAGLMDQESDSEYASGDENSGFSINPPVRRENKKTRTQRNKEKRIKEKEKEMLKRKMEKSRKKQVFRIKQLKKEADDFGKKVTKNAAYRNDLKLHMKNKTKKLGKYKFEEPDIEIKLSDELVGTFRELKPEGHLLEDRFKSLQKRNIIEPRKRVSIVKKYKRKEFEKKSHRNVVS